MAPGGQDPYAAQSKARRVAGLGRDFLQGASNAAASTVSAPVDALAWGLRKLGVPVPNAPVGGSDWMAQRGLTVEPQSKIAGVIGEAFGGAAPMLAAAKAPQIAANIRRIAENARTPTMTGPIGNQRGAVQVRFIKDESKGWKPDVSLENGELAYRGNSLLRHGGELRDWLREKAIDIVAPKYEHFFRFTNNPREIDLIRSGQLRPSMNHLDQLPEAGLSVANGPHYSIHGYKFGYPIKGEIIGAGSDGEPLLALKSLQPLMGRPTASANLVATDRQLMAQRLGELGLPRDWLNGIEYLNDPYQVFGK